MKAGAIFLAIMLITYGIAGMSSAIFASTMILGATGLIIWVVKNA